MPAQSARNCPHNSNCGRSFDRYIPYKIFAPFPGQFINIFCCGCVSTWPSHMLLRAQLFSMHPANQLISYAHMSMAAEIRSREMNRGRREFFHHHQHHGLFSSDERLSFWSMLMDGETFVKIANCSVMTTNSNRFNEARKLAAFPLMNITRKKCLA